MQPANIVPIRLQTWPPKALIVSGLSIPKNIFSSDAACPNELKLGWKHIFNHKELPMTAMFVNGSGRN
jgi:hypothetical protein